MTAPTPQKQSAPVTVLPAVSRTPPKKKSVQNKKTKKMQKKVVKKKKVKKTAFKMKAMGKKSSTQHKKAKKTAAELTPVMVTPTKKRKGIEDLPPYQKSPDRMANGQFCFGCKHTDLEKLTPYEQDHFKPSFCSLVNYPKACSFCARSLLPGKDRKLHCPIKGIMVVRCCWNAVNHRDHECVFAMCHDCLIVESDKKVKELMQLRNQPTRSPKG